MSIVSSVSSIRGVTCVRNLLSKEIQILRQHHHCLILYADGYMKRQLDSTIKPNKNKPFSMFRTT